MTHPHEGLQERALREAAITAVAKIEMDREGYPLSRTQQEIYDDAAEMVDAVFALSTPPVHDQGLRDALERIEGRVAGASRMWHDSQQWREEDAADMEAGATGNVWDWIFRDVRAALSLPQQAETDEGDRIAAAIKATEYKYFGDYEMSDEQREAVDVLVETAKRYALSTPTSQPPAAETRLMGEQRDVTAKIIAAGYSGDPWWWKEAFDDDQDETAVRLPDDDRKIADDVIAALTQPEPTAQQAGSDWFAGDVDVDGNELITVRKDEWEKLIEQRDKFKWQVRDTCVRAEKAEAAQQATDCPDCDGTGYRQASTAHKGGDCPTCAATGDRLAQQAAGEAEAVDFNLSPHDDPAFVEAWMDMEAKGYLYTESSIEKVHLGWLLARSATPQPTETPIKRIEDGHADTEGEAAERFAHLNCPTCGGSGHIDDVQPTETQRIVAGLNEVRDLMLERIQGSPARSAAHNARVRLETIIRELSGEHLAGEGDKA